MPFPLPGSTAWCLLRPLWACWYLLCAPKTASVQPSPSLTNPPGLGKGFQKWRQSHRPLVFEACAYCCVTSL